MPFANFKVPAGTLSARQKETIVHRATELYVELYGERARANTMVLVEEVADGGWGVGGSVLTLAMLGGPGPGSVPGSADGPASAGAAGAPAAS
jgi:4-oxalocrotonate tautomerase